MYDELRRSKEEYVRGLIRTDIPLVGRGSIDESEAIRWMVSHVLWRSCHLRDLCRLWWAAIARPMHSPGLIRFLLRAIAKRGWIVQYSDRLWTFRSSMYEFLKILQLKRIDKMCYSRKLQKSVITFLSTPRKLWETVKWKSPCYCREEFDYDGEPEENCPIVSNNDATSSMLLAAFNRPFA